MPPPTKAKKRKPKVKKRKPTPKQPAAQGPSLFTDLWPENAHIALKDAYAKFHTADGSDYWFKVAEYVSDATQKQFSVKQCKSRRQNASKAKFGAYRIGGRPEADAAGAATHGTGTGSERPMPQRASKMKSRCVQTTHPCHARRQSCGRTGS